MDNDMDPSLLVCRHGAHGALTSVTVTAPAQTLSHTLIQTQQQCISFPLCVCATCHVSVFFFVVILNAFTLMHTCTHAITHTVHVGTKICYI